MVLRQQITKQTKYEYVCKISLTNLSNIRVAHLWLHGGLSPAYIFLSDVRKYGDDFVCSFIAI